MGLIAHTDEGTIRVPGGLVVGQPIEEDFWLEARSGIEPLYAALQAAA